MTPVFDKLSRFPKRFPKQFIGNQFPERFPSGSRPVPTDGNRFVSAKWFPRFPSLREGTGEPVRLTGGVQ